MLQQPTNLSDKSIYPDVVSRLSPETLKKIHFMVADPGLNGRKLYDFSMEKGFQLVCPVKKYKNTPVEKTETGRFLSIGFRTGSLFKETYIGRTTDRTHISSL